MEVDSHSMTAVMVAAIRAYHTARAEPRIFDDALARALLSDLDCKMYEGICAIGLQRLNPSQARACSDSASFVYHAERAAADPALVLVRARYIEDSLAHAIERGLLQYVIIGAGLDSFAFRRPDRAGRLQVFEIDHPATQAFKRERLATAGLVPPAHLHFAAADLERETVSAALDRTPYDPTQPAFFAWPGVTMYLSRDAVLSTFRSIRSIAAPGSELVFDYLEPRAFEPDAPPRIASLLQRVRQLGEPMLSGLDPATLRAELSSVGFDLIEDIGPDAVQARYLDRIDGFLAAEYWRLARAAVR